MAAAPSTAPANPLEASMKKVLGEKETPDLIGYDPNASFRPSGDILTINQSPGSGASTAETWGHEAELERLRQASLEQEWKERVQAESDARAAAQLEMDKADAARKAALGGPQLSAAELANQRAQQEMAAGAQSMKFATTEEARKAATTASGLQKQQQEMTLAQQQAALEEAKFISANRGMTSQAVRQMPTQAGFRYAMVGPANYGTPNALAYESMMRGQPYSTYESGRYNPYGGFEFTPGGNPNVQGRFVVAPQSPDANLNAYKAPGFTGYQPPGMTGVSGYRPMQMTYVPTTGQAIPMDLSTPLGQSQYRAVMTQGSGAQQNPYRYY